MWNKKVLSFISTYIQLEDLLYHDRHTGCLSSKGTNVYCSLLISLLPSFLKFLEKVVCDKLTVYLEAKNSGLLWGSPSCYRKSNWHQSWMTVHYDAVDAEESVKGILADLIWGVWLCLMQVFLFLSCQHLASNVSL